MKPTLIILFSLWGMSFSFGQDKNVEVFCGDKIESAFTNNHEWQSFSIKLNGGDNLKIYAASKYGDYLKFNIDVYGPSGNVLTQNTDYKNIQQITTGSLPGSGIYYVNPYNYRHVQRFKGNQGDYTIEFVCEKANGDVISPENKINPSKKQIVEDKTQFFSIPFGTPMEGEITPSSSQLFGFKTKIDRNTQATLDFSITQGSTPLEIQIFDPGDKSVIFFSSLGHAGSIQAKINFPDTREYIVSIKESSSKSGNNGKTKFTVSLK